MQSTLPMCCSAAAGTACPGDCLSILTHRLPLAIIAPFCRCCCMRSLPAFTCCPHPAVLLRPAVSLLPAWFLICCVSCCLSALLLLCPCLLLCLPCLLASPPLLCPLPPGRGGGARVQAGPADHSRLQQPVPVRDAGGYKALLGRRAGLRVGRRTDGRAGSTGQNVGSQTVWALFLQRLLVRGLFS